MWFQFEMPFPSRTGAHRLFSDIDGCITVRLNGIKYSVKIGGPLVARLIESSTR